MDVKLYREFIKFITVFGEFKKENEKLIKDFSQYNDMSILFENLDSLIESYVERVEKIIDKS